MDILGLGSRHGLNNFEQIAILIVLVTAFISLIYAWLLKRSVLKKDKGDSKMQEVWGSYPYWSGKLFVETIKDNITCNGYFVYCIVSFSVCCSIYC